MPELNPEHLASVIRIINACPFFKHMSMAVKEIGVGFSVVAARIRENHMNPFGGLHGGVYSALIDTAAYWSAYCDLPEEKGLVSIDLKVDFLAPVTSGEIVITGKRIKSGKTIYLAEAKMYEGNGKLLAHGTSKLMVTKNQQSMNDVVAYIGTERLPAKFIRA